MGAGQSQLHCLNGRERWLSPGQSDLCPLPSVDQPQREQPFYGIVNKLETDQDAPLYEERQNKCLEMGVRLILEDDNTSPCLPDVRATLGIPCNKTDDFP
jgi:hypothetical protein